MQARHAAWVNVRPCDAARPHADAPDRLAQANANRRDVGLWPWMEGSDTDEALYDLLCAPSCATPPATPRTSEPSPLTPVEYTSTPIHDGANGAITGAVVTFWDITARRALEEALQHQATHDGLTRLPNRTLLRDRLDQALHAARRDNAPVALLLLDLDGFKEVNDRWGHDACKCQL